MVWQSTQENQQNSHVIIGTYFDTIAHILSFEYHLSNSLDPFLLTWNRIRVEKNSLLIGAYAKLFLPHRIASDGISQVHNAVREIWILIRE